jgi:glycosyltransferase involved in cell wall biosynthesis
MDRVADELLAALGRDHAGAILATPVAPPFSRRATRVAPGRLAANLDRGLNRLFDYPAHVGRARDDFDVFHVVDHSYAQLVHRLPAERTIVTCHDLDTFRSILPPEGDSETRSPVFRAMTRHILAGLQRAAVVTCDTQAVREELLAAGLVSAERIRVVPVGVSRVFNAEPNPEADRRAARSLPAAAPGTIELLHVGSVSERKRVDVLLAVCAELRRSVPGLRLVRVGDPLTAAQTRTMRSLELESTVISIPPVDDEMLAALYRRATLVLLPSAREGFGLPVVEAQACGTPVVASDLPVLREVGGCSVAYCPVGDTGAWSRAIVALLHERVHAPERWTARRAQGASWAQRYAWSQFTDHIVSIYLDLAGVAHVSRRIA